MISSSPKHEKKSRTFRQEQFLKHQRTVASRRFLPAQKRMENQRNHAISQMQRDLVTNGNATSRSSVAEDNLTDLATSRYQFQFL